MKQKLTLTTLIALAGLAGASFGQSTFNFHDGSALVGTGIVFDDAEGSAQDTQGAFTLTAEAFLDGNSTGTALNGSNSDSFGVNAAGTGDETSRFDNDLGIESMVFSFNIGGTFESIDLRFIEETVNEAVLSFDGGNTFELNTSTRLSTNDDFTINEAFTAGQAITLQISASAGAGENFGLESFTVVPEPNIFGLLAGFTGLIFVMLKRRHA